jgi:pimeloyl-ACP methyl ester carboxylesterase
LKINGVELNVKTSGTGTPFVWGHGLTLNMAVEDSVPWAVQWDQLADIAKVVRYDARGHGLSGVSDRPEDYHWSNLAKDMLAVADRSGFDRFIAGGQSMGCATSIYAALAAPERIKGLVLMNPPTAWETRAAQAGVYDQMADIVATKGVSVLADLSQQNPLLPAWQVQALPDMSANFATYIKTFNEQTLALVLRGAKLCNLPDREKLTALTMPALILAWVDDPGHPLSSAEELARLLPNSQLNIAHNAAEASEWTQQIRDFVTQLR